MKPISPLLFAMFALSVIAVNAQNARNNGYVNVTVGDENATSELLRMPLGSEGTSADFDIGIMYFGPSSDSDLSTILYMNGSRARYSSESAYGVKLITDDIALRSNHLRGVLRVVKEKGYDRLHFHLKREELAWLATGERIRIEVYDTQNAKLFDSISFTRSNVAEFKRFAKSVLLITSTID